MPLPSKGAELIDVASTTVTYIGKAKWKNASQAGTVWQIQKINYTAGGDPSSIQWADGDELYNNVWNNRATTVVYV